MSGIANDNLQVPTLAPQDPFTHTLVLLALAFSTDQVEHCRGHTFEGRIKFPLNICSTEQESEETAHASLFPEGCSRLVVKQSEETAELENRDLPLDAPAGKHDTHR